MPQAHLTAARGYVIAPRDLRPRVTRARLRATRLDSREDAQQLGSWLAASPSTSVASCVPACSPAPRAPVKKSSTMNSPPDEKPSRLVCSPDPIEYRVAGSTGS